MKLPNHLDQEGGRAGGEPVVANLLRVHGIEQAEGIVNTGRIGGEVIAVVLPLQLLQYIVLRNVLALCQSTDALLEVILQFLLRDAAQRGVLGQHGDVVEVVELGEDAQLRKLADARDEHEAEVRVEVF